MGTLPLQVESACLKGRSTTRRRSLPLAALAAFLLSPGLAADEGSPFDRTRISAVAFGDAYWMAEHHDRDIEGASGLWFRRINLTFDHELSESLSVRLRFETASPGDFVSPDRLEPFVKDAYVRWKSGRTTVDLGLAATPTWSVVEDEWGHRPIEKTPVDLYRLGSSRDGGVAVRGRFGAGDRGSYHLMLGNGAGVGSETDKGKKAMLSLGYRPAKRLLFEVYGDVEDRPEGDRRTAHAFASVRLERGRVGLFAARQRRDTLGGRPLEIDVASIWGVHELSDRLELIARIDRVFDPHPEAARISYLSLSPAAELSLALLGVAFELHEHLTLAPNVEYVFYESAAGRPAPDDDLAVRLTFSFGF